MKRSLRFSSIAVLGLAGIACASFGRREQGAVIGAAVGAAGGAAGAIIGHQMDQQAKELRLEIPGATITRIGEGIAVTFASGLMYDFDSDAIRSDAGLNLRTLATSLRKYPETALLIVGHTDALGSSDYNRDLSERRASAAMRYLSGYGITSGRVASSGRGELEPLGSNDSDAGRQQNRRIEVAIYASAAARNGTSGSAPRTDK
jgi:outer membrane protein OmpA-like peptidoglycan-associated protein